MNGKHFFRLAVILAVILVGVGCLGRSEWYDTENADLDQFGTMAALDVQERQSYLDATAQAAVVQATMEARRAAAEVQRIAATRQAEAATSAAWDQALQATTLAHNLEVQLTAEAQRTAQAVAVAATTQAMAIEATRAAYELQATQQAEQFNREATGTAIARSDMATAEAHYATRQAEATAAIDRATQQSHQATATRAAAIREERLGGFRDYGLPVFLLLLIGGLVVLAVWGVRQWSKRPVVYERSLLGDAPLLVSSVQGGGYTVLDADRQPGAVITVLPNGAAQAPQLRSPAQEERTTARDQMLDAASRPRLGAGHSGPVPQLAADPPQAPVPGLTGVRILRRLDQAETAGLLPPGQVEAIETVWKETSDE
jgi:hypothetical protein